MDLPVLTADALLAGVKLQFDPPADPKKLEAYIVEAFARYVCGWLDNKRRSDIEEAHTARKPMPELAAHYAVPIPVCVTDDVAKLVLREYARQGRGWEHSCCIGSPGSRFLIVAREPYPIGSGRGQRLQPGSVQRAT